MPQGMASPYARIRRSLLFNSYIYVPSGCHIPPISDDELLTRVNATNANDVDNGLGGWICRKCSRSLQPVPKPPAPVALPAVANKPFTQQSAFARPQAQSPDLALSKKFVAAPKLKYKQAAARMPSVRSPISSDDGQVSLTTSAAQPDTPDVSSRKGSELLFTGSSSKEGISDDQSVSLEPAPMASLATKQMQAATKDSGKDNAKSGAETPTKKKADPRRSGKSKNKRIPPNRSKGKATSREDDELEIETQNLHPSQPKQTTGISITTVLTNHEPSLGTPSSSGEIFSHVSDSRRKRKESPVGRPEPSLYTIEPGATLASDVSISLREMH